MILGQWSFAALPRNLVGSRPTATPDRFSGLNPHPIVPQPSRMFAKLASHFTDTLHWDLVYGLMRTVHETHR